MANEIQIPLDPNPLGPMEPIFFTGTITPLSQVYADLVRSKLFGKHVREALARGILIASIDANEAKDIARIANAKSDETSERQDELEEHWETVLAETTDGAEVIDARTGLRGTSWPTIKGRLDSMQAIDDKLNPVSEVFSIEHNQNCYPVVRVLAFENGLGIGPLGVNLGGSNTITVNCDAEFIGRNHLKVKVPLAFAMTNPTTERISANEYLLVEGIKSLIIEVGTKAEANVETIVTTTFTSDFTGKIAGSVIENGNTARYNTTENAIISPGDFKSEFVQVSYDRIKKLDGDLQTNQINSLNMRTQILVKYDVIWILERVLPSIFKTATTTAEKVAIAKKTITSSTVNAYVKGSGANGNKVTMSLRNPRTNVREGARNNATPNIGLITYPNTLQNALYYMDDNGIMPIILYAEASSATIQSIVSVDYTNIKLTARVPFSKI